MSIWTPRDGGAMSHERRTVNGGHLAEMASPPRKTKKGPRTEEFRAHAGPGMPFARPLVDSAFALLAQALQHRHGNGWREPHNHFTEHAPGALVLIVTAFDAWATEFAVGLDLSKPGLRRIAEEPLCARYASLLGQLAIPPRGDDLPKARRFDGGNEDRGFVMEHVRSVPS